MSADLKSVQRHETYYLTGGDLHLLAGGTLFRVHRYFFERESKDFRETLSRPSSPGRGTQGNSDSTAIVLDTSAAELERFCWVFYNPRYSLWDASFSDWTTILKLAHDWGFAEVKSLAIRQLEVMPIPVVERIVTYQTYKVDDDVLVPHYVNLCGREDLLTFDEAQQLGMPTTLMVCNTRERLRSSSGDGLKSPLPPDLEQSDVERTIRQILGGSQDASHDASTQGGLVLLLSNHSFLFTH
ncbi:hypothetical protein HGRIS_001951 [Hohenbuehelia grisea]|uniref:BTB domain-containing protein n=1 Tax=Hohenbuehelia grisea TaxID=104357 RepID=A0ABR3JKR5_9AGAR